MSWCYIRNVTLETSLAKRHLRNVNCETQVEAESAAVGHLEQKQFVGSMAFNRFMQASASPTTTSTTVPTNSNNDSSSSSADAEEQDDATLDDDYEPGFYYTDGDDDGYIVDDSSNHVPGRGGVFEEAKEVALNVLRRDSIVGSMAQSFVADAEGDRRHGAGQMERSATTVTATTDVSRTRLTSV